MSTVPGPPESQGTRAPVSGPTHVRSANGVWIPKPAGAPKFQLSSHVFANQNSSDHFFVSISLSFPNRKPIRTYALVDSGATASCISLSFANRHGLPRCLKDKPVPITAVDDRPIASGLVTHDVVTFLSLQKHSENISLAIVSISFPVILGLDWLRRHNPSIDWARNCLALSCCGANPSYPVSALGKGFGLAHVSPLVSSSQSCSATSVGLGLGLNGRTLVPSHPDAIARSDRVSGLHALSYLSTVTSSPLAPYPSSSIGSGQTGTFSSLWKSLSSTSTDSMSPRPSLNIAVVNSMRFRKYARNNESALLWYHPVGTPGYQIASARLHAPSPDPPVPVPPDPPDYLRSVPTKYHKFYSQVHFFSRIPHPFREEEDR